MKISKEDFQEMRTKYSQEVKKGKPAKTPKGDKTDQTNWLFFDRETLEGLLAQVDQDPKKGGIQIYLAEYTEDTAKKFYPESYQSLVGALTLVLCPANINENVLTQVASAGEVTYENKGQICPPYCEPDPTDV